MSQNHHTSHPAEFCNGKGISPEKSPVPTFLKSSVFGIQLDRTKNHKLHQNQKK